MGSGAIGCVAEPELTELIVAPCPHSAIDSEDGGVYSPCGYGLHVRNAADVHRNIGVSEGSVAELTVVIVSKGAERAIGSQGDRMLASTGDSDDIAQTGHENRSVAVR